MKIIHISDNHSYFFTLPNDGDVIIHSGDLLPNAGRPINRYKEAQFQTDWLKKKVNDFKEWIDSRPFYFCSGNHDFIDPVPILKDAGIDAHNITNEFQQFCGETIYGIPYIPFIDNEWNWELQIKEMKEEFIRADQLFNSGIQIYERMPKILVCHCPPHGILSNRWGNSTLSDFISYVWKDNLPKVLLCGHVHEQGGKIAEVFEMKIYNSACCVQVVEI